MSLSNGGTVENPTSVYHKISHLPIAATRGFFLNSTASPLATGSFGTPSKINFDPFVPVSTDTSFSTRRSSLWVYTVIGLVCAMFELR